MNFEAFVRFASESRSITPRAMVFEPGIELYIRAITPWRRGLRPVGVDFELANMQADDPGQGALTRFLDRYEPHYGFLVELIHNSRLPEYLGRRGYLPFQRCAGSDAPSLYRARSEAL